FVAHQERVGHLAPDDADVAVDLVGASFIAHRAVLAADALAPVRRPLALHRSGTLASRVKVTILSKSGSYPFVVSTTRRSVPMSILNTESSPVHASSTALLMWTRCRLLAARPA